MNILPLTALSSTKRWVSKPSVASIHAEQNSTDGMTWFTWKRFYKKITLDKFTLRAYNLSYAKFAWHEEIL